MSETKYPQLIVRCNYKDQVEKRAEELGYTGYAEYVRDLIEKDLKKAKKKAASKN